MKAVSFEEQNEKMGSYCARSPGCVLPCHGSAPGVSLTLPGHPEKALTQGCEPWSAPCGELTCRASSSAPLGASLATPAVNSTAVLMVQGLCVGQQRMLCELCGSSGWKP